MKSISSATTRSGPAPFRPATRPHLLQPAQVVASPETRLRYEIQRWLGEGGFGQAYRARCLERSSEVAETVCIKASLNMDGWLREAYFGQLLHGHPRAIRVFDAFPLLRPDHTLFQTPPPADTCRSKMFCREFPL